MAKQRLSELEISQINVDSASQTKRGKENTPASANQEVYFLFHLGRLVGWRTYIVIDDSEMWWNDRPSLHLQKPNWKIQHDELRENIRNAREITKAVKEGKPVPPPSKPAGTGGLLAS